MLGCLVGFPNLLKNKCNSNCTAITVWTDLLIITVVIVLDSRNSHLVSIRVHGGQNMDAGGVDEGLDALVPQQILWAQVLSQVDQQLPAQDFISMHVADVLYLGLDYRGVTFTTGYRSNVLDNEKGCTGWLSALALTLGFTYAVHVRRGCLRTRSQASPCPPCCGRCCRFSLCRSIDPQFSSRYLSSERWSDIWTASR